MDDDDYYTILGVEHNASTQDIKRVYRQMAHRYHPDLNQSDPAVEERFKIINLAAEVLTHPGKRALYDRFGHNWQCYADQSYTNYAPFNPHSSSGTYTPADRNDQRDGHDVFYQLTIMRSDAVMDTCRSLQFHTPHGQPYTIDIHIPSGVKSGMRICVPGVGGPGLNCGQRGDFYAVIRVV
jgi:curved DNA-binding protein